MSTIIVPDRKVNTAWVPELNSRPSTSFPWVVSAVMPAAISTADTAQKMRRFFIQSTLGVRSSVSMRMWSLITPISTSSWKIHRVTTSEVNRLNITPNPRVIAKPRISSVPTQPRIKQVISVVALPSRMALAALE